MRYNTRLLAILAAALAVRLALAPFTGHPYDLPIWMQTGEQVAGGKSPYDLIYHLGYPDLWAFWTATSYILACTLGDNKFLYILLIKLPIILGDFAVVYILVRLARSRTEPLQTDTSPGLERRILVSYLFNPYVVAVGAVWGMMDNLAAALMLLFFFLAHTRRLTSAALAHCLSILLKLYPIVFFPLIILKIEKTHHPDRFAWTKILGVSIIASLVIGILPFYLFGWNIWIFLYSTFHQILRDPGGIGPLGILSNVYAMNRDLAVAVTSSWWFTPFRFAWVIALGVTFPLISMRRWRSPFGFAIIVSFVWYLTFVWISEPNLLMGFTFILAQAATARDHTWHRSFWIGSLIAFAYIILNVPVWGFAFPMTTIRVESELWLQFVRPISLTVLSVAFTIYAVWEIRRTSRIFMNPACRV